jgi:hypothetical protein
MILPMMWISDLQELCTNTGSHVTNEQVRFVSSFTLTDSLEAAFRLFFRSEGMLVMLSSFEGSFARSPFDFPALGG